MNSLVVYSTFEQSENVAIAVVAIPTSSFNFIELFLYLFLYTEPLVITVLNLILRMEKK